MFTLESFIQNNRPTSGEIVVVNGGELQGAHWDAGLNRPYIDERGRVWVDVTIGTKPRMTANGQPVLNASGRPVLDRIFEPQLVSDRLRHGLPVANVTNASVLRKDQWIALDTIVGQASRARLRAWSDLRAASTMGGFDGMATPILEHEIVTDVGEAIADMEAIAEGRNFQPSFALQGLPLPITHSDFWLSERFLAASRAKGMPQDTMRGEMAGRRVGELIEKTLIGTETGVTYGDSSTYMGTSKVYGYTNHPDRITKTDLQTSANMATNIATTGGPLFVQDLIEMRELMFSQNFFGPFMVYISTAYDGLLDHDFKANGDRSIRARASEIDGIQGIRRLDYLTGDVILMVQMTSDVVQAVNGLEITTVQWAAKGGMQHMFKVMCIQVPRIRSVYKSGTTSRVTGILHATTS
jgi:hypothetical protein